MALTEILIKTLTIKQLSERWPHYSRENILELANDGHFGLYVQLQVKRKTYHDVKQKIEKLVNAVTSQDTDRENYMKLKQMLCDFIATRQFLLEPKPGYERLPTLAETEFLPESKASSIQRIIEDGKIQFNDFNNVFGITENNGLITANSYYCKGFMSSDNLFVFIDQIQRVNDLCQKKDEESHGEKQFLNRKAITLIYAKLSENKWRHIFNTEKKNGLFERRVRVHNKGGVIYEQKELHAWLVEKGIYTPQELLKISNPSTYNQIPPSPLGIKM